MFSLTLLFTKLGGKIVYYQFQKVSVVISYFKFPTCQFSFSNKNGDVAVSLSTKFLLWNDYSVYFWTVKTF